MTDLTAGPFDESPPGPAGSPAAAEDAISGPGVETQPQGAQPQGDPGVPADLGGGSPRSYEVYRVYRWTPDQQRRLEEFARTIIDFMASDLEASQLLRQFRLTRNPSQDRQQRMRMEDVLRPRFMELNLPMRQDEVGPAVDIAYDELLGLGPLGVPWRDDAVTEILVDGWDRIYVEVSGRLVPTTARFRDPEHANSIARNLARMVSDRALSPTNPLVTAQLDGARVNFAYGPVVASGLAISLRKFRPLMGMSGLIQGGSLGQEAADFLRDCVRARATILVSGGTGVGKTTMVNALSEFIPDDERVITIEDSLELKLANRFVVSLQTKEQASRDDDALVDQEALLINSLRMRPDRIIVGEVREGKAAAQMLRAANTGHDGTMTTIHANNVDAALNATLSNLVRAGSEVSDDIAKYQIADAFDLVVQGTRKRGKRFVSEISEVTARGLADTGRLSPNPVFRGSLTSAGDVVHERAGGIDPRGDLAEKLAEAGIDPARWV